MKLRSGKVITKKDKPTLLDAKILMGFHNEIMKRHTNKKISNGSRGCVHEIILESLKKGINIKFE
tara:strand:- start:92 stop:286 length:195 start_codon:yes stop_codon:yes gene_type:complete